MTCLLLLHGILQDLFVQVSLVEADVNAVASGHQVVVVDDLQFRSKNISESIVNRKKHLGIEIADLSCAIINDNL